jgi:hypothetical protein
VECLSSPELRLCHTISLCGVVVVLRVVDNKLLVWGT